MMLLGALAGCARTAPTKAPNPTDPVSGAPLATDPVNGAPLATDPVSGAPIEGSTATLPSGLSGTDAAKLLLAEERLNAQLLKNDGNIFAEGPKVFSTLEAIANKNFESVAYSASHSAVITPLSASTAKSKAISSASILGNTNKDALNIVPVATTKYERPDGSSLEIDGNTYKWGNFSEYSNSYDYFLNLTNNIVSSAKSGSELIDYTKKFVRVLDKWVDVGGTQYYLHVENDMEIIYSRSTDYQAICKRYKRADGTNVYELYRINSEGGQTRVTYIPGEKYEYCYLLDTFNHNFCAENTKGFWEVADVSKTDWGYNVSCMVLKDDICYDAFYDPQAQAITLLKVISADRKTDIMFFGDGENYSSISLMLQGFDGVDHVEISATPEEVTTDATQADKKIFKYYGDSESLIFQTTGSEECFTVLKSGIELKNGDSFLDGKIAIHRTIVSHSFKEDPVGSSGYSAELNILVIGDSYEERMATLNQFFDLVGLSCRRDMTVVSSGILQAYSELSQLTKYHQWSESPIYTVEGLNKGYENYLAKYSAFAAELDALKDAPVIISEDREAMELNMHFAPITAQTATSVKNDGATISVTDLELTIEDTLLMIADESYQVNFALIGILEGMNSGLNHVELKSPITVKYAGEDVFKVKQTASFDIPVLASGEYEIVAYISTADGIRVSAYQSLAFTEVNAYETKDGNISVIISKTAEGKLLVSCIEIQIIEVAINYPESNIHSYATMLDELSNQAYTFGFADDNAVIEKQGDGDTWIALNGDEAELEAGVYRISYSIKNGTSLVEGYVYTNYNPSPADEEKPAAEQVIPATE